MSPRPLSRESSLRPCQKCGKRPGTMKWGDLMAQTHGFAASWCAVCVYTAQLKHARERADAIPELERKLAKARADA